MGRFLLLLAAVEVQAAGRIVRRRSAKVRVEGVECGNRVRGAGRIGRVHGHAAILVRAAVTVEVEDRFRALETHRRTGGVATECGGGSQQDLPADVRAMEAEPARDSYRLRPDYCFALNFVGVLSIAEVNVES